MVSFGPGKRCKHRKLSPLTGLNLRMEVLYTMKRQKLINARLSRRLEQADVAEALVVTPVTVSRWERGVSTPYKVHIDGLCTFFKMNREQLDLPTVDLPEQHAQPVQEDPVASEHATPRVELLMETRRQALHDIVDVATALLISPYALLPKESRERLLMAKIHPSYLNDEALDDLSTITASYWRLTKKVPLDRLINGVTGHFEDITQYLKDSHPTRIYNKLCALASENAQLLGRIFHLIKECKLSDAYYTFALKVALDIEHTDLWAAGVARVGLYHLHWGNPSEALPLLQGGQRTTLHDTRLRAYLSSIEAEIHAEMKDMNACQKLLEQAKNVELSASLENDIYWTTGFGPSLRYGHEGSCYIRLRKPELALDALKQGEALTDSSFIRRQATDMTDMGKVYAQLGDQKKACELLGQALDTIIQVRSLSGLQRVYKARAELAPWETSAEVKVLDDKLDNTVKALNKRPKDS